MITMYSYNETLFCEHVTELIKTGSLKEGVDLIHLLLIACEVEFNSVEVPGILDIVFHRYCRGFKIMKN